MGDKSVDGDRHTPPKYDLGYSDRELARLDLQQFQFIHAFGSLLDESIPYQTPGLQIADFCCGTGIWLISVARKVHPTTTLHAFDLQPTSFPPQAWLPKGPTIVLHNEPYNIYSTPPEELHHKFDIINLSLTLTFVMTESQLKHVQDNMLYMLKPGGYLQWAEEDLANVVTLSPDPAYKLQYMNIMVDKLMDFFQGSHSAWIPDMGKYFESHPELQNVKVYRPEVDPVMLPSWTRQALISTSNGLTGFRESIDDGDKEKLAEFERVCVLVENAKKEHIEKGAALYPSPVRVNARKKSRA